MNDIVSFVKFKEILKLKRYSANTIKSYGHALSSFQKFVGDTPIERLDNRFIIRHTIDFIEKKNFSPSSQKQLIGALTLFYKELFQRPINFSTIYPARATKFLPEILSKEEVSSLFSNTSNLKHLTILKTIYALGLRRGELLNLKVSDIDGKRKVVHIKNAKGSKDRILPLSEKLLAQLRQYYLIYKPKLYLFQGANRDQYSAASLRNIFVNACKRSRIQKKVSLHSLRHAYATHLMDAGTNVRIIQELLGHESIKTTMRYTHVTTFSIQNIPSPLDFID